MECIVIGAGVAGIAAAQGLRRIGARVTLLERSREHRETGYQMNVLANGRYALDRLGLLDALDRAGRGWPLDEGIIVDGTSGRVVQRLRQHPDHGRLRACSHFRSDVHAALLSGLVGEAPRCGVEVAHIEDLGDGPVRVHCADGDRLEADLVVVADGARSQLRDALFGPRHAWVPLLVGVLAAARVDPAGRSLAERLFRAQADRNQFVQVSMPGAVAVLSLSAGGEIGFAIGAPLSEDPGDVDGTGMRAFAESTAHGINDPRVAHAIESACWDADDPARPPLLWRVGDIAPLPQLVRGRIALVGDAAHAMMPVLGQGANQSFEDAMVLAEQLRRVVGLSGAARRREVHEALVRFSHERRPRVAAIQTLARRIVDSQLHVSPLRHRWIGTMLRHTPRVVMNRRQNAMLRYAIEDSCCEVQALDERWIRFRSGRAVPGRERPAPPTRSARGVR